MVLEMSAVSLIRGGREVLSDLDWRVRPGERWVVFGPNGAGKSSLLEVASTYEIASRGRVDVLGARVGTVDLRQLRRRVGYAGAPLARRIRPQLTVRDVVLTGPRAMLSTFRQHFASTDRIRAEELLSELGLAELADRRVDQVSEGERQRAQLARVLVAEPDLLLLDEPTAGLDLAGREQLLSRLDAMADADPGRPVVLVTHQLEEVPASSTRALLLRDGRVFAAGPIETTLTSEALSECVGAAITVEHRDGRYTARRRPQPLRSGGAKLG